MLSLLRVATVFIAVCTLHVSLLAYPDLVATDNDGWHKDWSEKTYQGEINYQLFYNGDQGIFAALKTGILEGAPHWRIDQAKKFVTCYHQNIPVGWENTLRSLPAEDVKASASASLDACTHAGNINFGYANQSFYLQSGPVCDAMLAAADREFQNCGRALVSMSYTKALVANDDNATPYQRMALFATIFSPVTSALLLAVSVTSTAVLATVVGYQWHRLQNIERRLASTRTPGS